MINKIMINKLLRNFVFSISVLALFSCATVDKRFADPEDAVHLGVQVFLDYQKSINSESEFDDEMQLFFSEAGRRRIQATQGWNRLVYSSSFRALKWARSRRSNLIPLPMLPKCRWRLNQRLKFQATAVRALPPRRF